MRWLVSIAVIFALNVTHCGGGTDHTGEVSCVMINVCLPSSQVGAAPEGSTTCCLLVDNCTVDGGGEVVSGYCR